MKSGCSLIVLHLVSDFIQGAQRSLWSGRYLQIRIYLLPLPQEESRTDIVACGQIAVVLLSVCECTNTVIVLVPYNFAGTIKRKF